MSTFLRTRYHALHDRFGTAGVVIGVIALVLALGGTALAAKGALTGKQKKEVTKIAEKYAGKPGAPGANGTNGTNGTAGAPGEKGAAGEKGEKGDKGDTGTNGKNVVLGNVTSCTEGGITAEVEGSPPTKKEVCNGEEGPPGPAGPTSLLLPEGETEYGQWVAQLVNKNAEYSVAQLSFPYRVEFGLGGQTVYVFAGGLQKPSGTGKCPGSYSDPKAEPGYLCIYASREQGLENGAEESPEETDTTPFIFQNFAGSDQIGDELLVSGEERPSFAESFVGGVWALTAETGTP